MYNRANTNIHVVYMYMIIAHCKYLNVDGPAQSSRHPEGLASIGVFNIAKDEKIKEEPTNHLHQLTIPLPLLLVNHVLAKAERQYHTFRGKIYQFTFSRKPQ